jgi:ATP-dependent 26S proteasome regulatory subunit
MTVGSDVASVASELERACTVSNLSIPHHVAEAESLPTALECSGYEDVQQYLRELIIWPKLFEKQGKQLGLRWPKGCLLHGPPGVGKTLLVKVRKQPAVAEGCMKRYVHICVPSVLVACSYPQRCIH